MVCVAEFLDIPELHEDITGKAVKRKVGLVKLVLANPLYNVRNERRSDSYLHDIFTLEDTSYFVVLVRHVMA